MKKFISLLICVLMFFTFFGCASKYATVETKTDLSPSTQVEPNDYITIREYDYDGNNNPTWYFYTEYYETGAYKSKNETYLLTEAIPGHHYIEYEEPNTSSRESKGYKRTNPANDANVYDDGYEILKYDNEWRVLSCSTYRDDGSLIECIEYTYDASGNKIKSVKQTEDGTITTIDYEYNDANLLIREAKTIVNNSNTETIVYEFEYEFDNKGFANVQRRIYGDNVQKTIITRDENGYIIRQDTYDEKENKLLVYGEYERYDKEDFLTGKINIEPEPIIVSDPTKGNQNVESPSLGFTSGEALVIGKQVSYVTSQYGYNFSSYVNNGANMFYYTDNPFGYYFLSKTYGDPTDENYIFGISCWTEGCELFNGIKIGDSVDSINSKLNINLNPQVDMAGEYDSDTLVEFTEFAQYKVFWAFDADSYNLKGADISVTDQGLINKWMN